MARAVNFVAAAIAALALVCAVSADSALATCGDQASTVSLSLASSCSSTQVFTFQGQKTFTYREVCLVWPKCCPAGDGCSAGSTCSSWRSPFSSLSGSASCDASCSATIKSRSDTVDHVCTGEAGGRAVYVKSGDSVTSQTPGRTTTSWADGTAICQYVRFIDNEEFSTVIYHVKDGSGGSCGALSAYVNGAAAECGAPAAGCSSSTSYTNECKWTFTVPKCVIPANETFIAVVDARGATRLNRRASDALTAQLNATGVANQQVVNVLPTLVKAKLHVLAGDMVLDMKRRQRRKLLRFLRKDRTGGVLVATNTSEVALNTVLTEMLGVRTRCTIKTLSTDVPTTITPTACPFCTAKARKQIANDVQNGLEVSAPGRFPASLPAQAGTLCFFCPSALEEYVVTSESCATLLSFPRAKGVLYLIGSDFKADKEFTPFVPTVLTLAANELGVPIVPPPASPSPVPTSPSPSPSPSPTPIPADAFGTCPLAKGAKKYPFDQATGCTVTKGATPYYVSEMYATERLVNSTDAGYVGEPIIETEYCVVIKTSPYCQSSGCATNLEMMMIYARPSCARELRKSATITNNKGRTRSLSPVWSSGDDGQPKDLVTLPDLRLDADTADGAEMCFKLLSNTNCADITQFCKDEASVCTFALADGALDYCPVYCAAQPL